MKNNRTNGAVDPLSSFESDLRVSVNSEPESITRAGSHLREVATQLHETTLDASLLSDDTVGHPALAQALRDFTEQWNRNLGLARSHIDELGVSVRQAGERYRDSDAASAMRFDNISRPGREGPNTVTTAASESLVNSARRSR